MKRNTIFSFTLLVVLLAGCGKIVSPKFAQDANTKRKEIGLPVIHKNWVNYNKFNNAKEANWRTPGSNHNSPNHSGKKVLYASGQWEMEQDYYYSGKTFPSHDPDGGKEWEKVTVSYSFVARPRYPKGWTCHYNGPKDSYTTITIEKAESILSSWGLKRLNY